MEYVDHIQCIKLINTTDKFQITWPSKNVARQIEKKTFKNSTSYSIPMAPL